MKVKNLILALICLSIINLACTEKNKKSDANSSANTESANEKTSNKTLTKEKQVLNQLFVAYGISNYLKQGSVCEFVFRKKSFKMTYFKDIGLKYESFYTKDGTKVHDILFENIYTYKENDTVKKLEALEEEKRKYNLNSVFYFATLPLKLQDKAVNSKIIKEDSIDGKKYYCMQVTFSKEGGGKDYEDVFLYWIDTTSFIIDYFAYSYKVNKGGIRLRKAFNSHVVNGIRFQDYVNYKPKKSDKTSSSDSVMTLEELVHNMDKMEVLSEILTEKVKVYHENL